MADHDEDQAQETAGEAAAEQTTGEARLAHISDFGPRMSLSQATGLNLPPEDAAGHAALNALTRVAPNPQVLLHVLAGNVSASATLGVQNLFAAVGVNGASGASQEGRETLVNPHTGEGERKLNFGLVENLLQKGASDREVEATSYLGALVLAAHPAPVNTAHGRMLQAFVSLAAPFAVNRAITSMDVTAGVTTKTPPAPFGDGADLEGASYLTDHSFVCASRIEHHLSLLHAELMSHPIMAPLFPTAIKTLRPVVSPRVGPEGFAWAVVWTVPRYQGSQLEAPAPVMVPKVKKSPPKAGKSGGNLH